MSSQGTISTPVLLTDNSPQSDIPPPASPAGRPPEGLDVDALRALVAAEVQRALQALAPAPVPVTVAETEQERDDAPAQDAPAILRVPETVVETVAETAEDCPAFDPRKFKLGEQVCPGGHGWGTTGVTLYNLRGQCPACLRETAQRYRQRQTTRRAQKKAPRAMRP